MAQGTKPEPTPAATPAKAGKVKPSTKAKAGEKPKAEEKTAEKAAEGEKPAPRFQRVSRRVKPAPRPIVSQESKPAAKQGEEPQKSAGKAKAAPAKPAATTAKTAVAKPKATPAPAPAKPVRAAKTAPVAKAKPATPDAVEEGAPKKKGGNPFSFIGKIFGGGKKKQAEEQAVTAGPPAPTPAPRQQRGRVSASPQDVEQVDYDAPLPSYQRHQQAPPVAVQRTVTNARGEMVTLDDDSDLPSAEPYAPQQRSLPPQPRQQPIAPAAQTPAAPIATTFDRTRYQETRRKASEDAEVASLGEKLNATTPGDDAHGPAARAYTIALFAKMRDLDPEQADWISRMEAATVRRIDAGKPVFAE